MTVSLIANVGNRDVWVDKAISLPCDINPHHDKDASRRALGIHLVQHWASCREHLALPMIGKAVRYVQQQAGQIDRVVLISSDQSAQEGVSARYLAQDTCELALCVERLLVEQYGLPEQAITHLQVRHNPADYGLMQRFYRDQLPLLRNELSEGRFYLEVSGGTPAMTSMLLVVGAEVFGASAHPLYVSEQEEQPFALDLGRRLVAESLVRTVRANLDIYAYHAAAQTVRDNAVLLADFVPVRPLLNILDYANKRQNFAFAEAQQALDAIGDSSWHEAVMATAQGMSQPDRMWVLREGIFAAQIAAQLAQYFEFATRVFQFAEGMLRALAIQVGVEFVNDDRDQSPDPDGKAISQTWQEKHALLVQDMHQEGINIGYGANRKVMHAIIKRLENRYLPVLDLMGRLEKISDLRNRVVHRYHPLTPELLRDTLYPKKKDKKRHSPQDAVNEIVVTMQQIWSAVAEQSFPDTSPYTTINRLVREMLTDDAARSKRQ